MRNLRNILKIVLLIFVFTVVFVSALLSNSRIKKYSERLYLDKNGDLKADVEFIVKSDSSLFIIFPLNFANAGSISFSDARIAKTNIENIEGVNYIKVYSKNGFDSSSAYKFCFKADGWFDYEKNKTEFGNYVFTYKYINTCPIKIEKFESVVFLPDGYVVNSVEETIPKVKSNNPEFPFELGRENGSNFVKIKNSKMGIGDNSFVKFRFKSGEKPYILLMFLAVIAVGYLILFRELINKNNKK